MLMILLFLKTDHIIITRVKLTMRASKGIFGLKINFPKSELIPLNIEHKFSLSGADLIIGRIT
jgi:hypothetical protein